MIKLILHQMWNERRQNGWLFLEIVAVSIFLWLAIDPLFILESRRSIPAGYVADNLYRIKLKEYKETHIKYNKNCRENSLEVCRNAFNVVKSIPEVEYVCTAIDRSYPNSGSISSSTCYIDSTLSADGETKSLGAVFYQITSEEGDNYPATFGLVNALTGETAQIVNNGNVNSVFVSRSFAMEGFGTLNVVGKKIRDSGGKSELMICGVVEDIPFQQYANPTHVVFHTYPSYESRYMGVFDMFIRLKEGVDGKAFMRRFNEEIAPQLGGGNIYCGGIKSHIDERDELNEMMGYGNTYRIQTALTLFAVLCTFLGVVGTFWMRANARRRDIGLMRSVGASSGRIVAQFVVEAVLLVTVAFLVAQPLLMHKVYAMGFAEPLVDFITRTDVKGDYIHDIAWVHFVAVSIISYIIILLVALSGVVIPACRIARILPSEALRDE